MCSPNDSFYNASAGSHPNGTVFNMVWRTHVLQMMVLVFNMVWRTHGLQMIVFVIPVRGLTQKQQFLIWFGEHMSSK